jgi:methionyl-tRNA formyltransferase
MRELKILFHTMKKPYKVCYIGGQELGRRGVKVFKKYAKHFIVKKSPKGCDYVFNLFGNKIFKKDVIDSVKYGIINFHYGHLPQYKGRFIVSHLINNDEDETVVTAHFINEGIDTGDIIFEKRVQIKKKDTAYSLYKKCTDKALELFEYTLFYILRYGFLPRRKQKGKGTYYPNKPLHNDEVNLRWDKKRIERFIRATTFPPYYPYITISGVKYYVKNSSLNPKL